MTEQEQRVAIAEVCGWKWFQKGHPEHDVYWMSPVGKHCHLPDYLHDLNAMHEAELALTSEQQWHYSEVLIGVVAGDMSRSYGPDGELEYGDHFAIFCATAAQRAEAFLRVKGLWRE